MFRVVSSTATSVGTLVNVSCPAGQKLQTGHSMTQTVCSRSGDWSPSVPDCVGKYALAFAAGGIRRSNLINHEQYFRTEVILIANKKSELMLMRRATASV